MDEQVLPKALRRFHRVRSGLLPLAAFTILLGMSNLLVVNQKVVLYLFYLPVVFAAWMLPKRDAVGVAGLAAAMVIAYVFFMPEKINHGANQALLWAELAIWGGILIMTAYLVSTLRTWTQEALRNLHRAYSGVLCILAKFIQTVDADTQAHSVRVSAWAIRIGQELGLKPDLIEEVRIAGMLHDVGKVDVSVEILRKAAALSRQENQAMREHASKGADIVKSVGGMLSHIADTIEAHHEKYDGSGYKGLKGEEIPLASRIISVSDAFDALLSDRPYRKGVSISEAMDSIAASSRTHFDPMIVATLQKIVSREGEQALSEAMRTAGEIESQVA